MPKQIHHPPSISAPVPPNRRARPQVLAVCVVAMIAWIGSGSWTAAQDHGTAAAENLQIWDASQPEQDSRWQFKDPLSWRFVEQEGQRVLSQFLKDSQYRPPHRSPLHMALWKDDSFGDFQFDCWLKSTHAEYGHRDVCLFFGYQAPDQFYYVHLASEMDDRANQIFLVNRSDRVKISETTSKGTRWDDRWHHVRITREVASGKIAVYFDDLEQPVMTATDTTLGAGQFGVGSFDDTADFRRIEIRRPPSSPIPAAGAPNDR
jgi:hypothetical protein